MSETDQDFKNHARMDPLFHYVLTVIFLLNLIFCAMNFYHAESWFNGWLIVVAVGLFLMLFKTRQYPLKVQDRVIRMEERLRLEELTPQSVWPRICELSEAQLVALRFASDEELPALTAQALDEHLTAKQIKQRVLRWRPDYFRV